MKKIIILLLCCGVLVSMVGCGSNTAPSLTECPPTMVSETVITETPTETAPDECDAEKEKLIKERFAFKYPFENASKVVAKTSVSEIVSGDKTANDFVSRPAFLSKAGLTPAQRGTATHRFMQFADYFAAARDLEGEMSRLTSEEFITTAESAAIDRKAIERFFASELFARMEKAVELHREMRFLSEMPASELFSVQTDEKTVVQGVIDCVIEEDDSITVLDFKTDRVSEGKELADRYAKQLEIYAAACEKMFSKPVKEKLIYSFSLSKTINV